MIAGMDESAAVRFFAEPRLWRTWLEANHDRADELWVGFYRTGSSRPSITWPESVDEALCFGWIDGVRTRIDVVSYRIRFTPRRRGSVWSAVNVERFQELTRLGLVAPSGRRAFDLRREDRTAIYAYENQPAGLPPEYEQRFRANEAAWRYFQAQPPSYRRTCTWWVTSARQEATRERRLATLIADSERELPSGTYRRAAGGAWSDAPASPPGS
jgi:uncharacterized protein YdeI (YjbR/CyaY-like superfamily)